MRIRVAGFGGQGVLMLGEVLAEAGLDVGLRSLLAAFLRAGDALGHVQLPRTAVERTHRFAAGFAAQRAAGAERAVAAQVPARSSRAALSSTTEGFARGLRARRTCAWWPCPSPSWPTGLGAAKAANIVMLGALLEATGLLDQERRDAAPYVKK